MKVSDLISAKVAGTGSTPNFVCYGKTGYRVANTMSGAVRRASPLSGRGW